jgi:lipopolysaccharide/colanic/teichoic acid biosynthesis glycosyltransferase
MISIALPAHVIPGVLGLSPGDAGNLLGLVLVIVLAVSSELTLRRLAQRSRDARAGRLGGRQPVMTAPRAQQLYRRILFTYAPAAVAGAMVAVREGNAKLGLLVLGSMVLVSTLMWPGRSPMRLLPVARVLLRFLLPAVGLAFALVPGLVEPWELTPASALPPLVAAWLVVAFGMWLETSFDAEHPIRLAVIGSQTLAKGLAVEMREMQVRDYVIVGFISDEPEAVPDERPEEILPWLGDLTEVREIVQTVGVDLLAVGPDTPRLQVFEETANACLDLPVRMIEASALYEDVLGHVPIGQINSAWFQCIMHPRYSPTSPLSKRLLDLAVSIPMAVLAAPWVAICAVLIKLSDGGEVFFRQRRVGEQGREFDIVKLRTMRPDAMDLARTHSREELMTPLGRILRKTHIDELPQLYNVIRGDMTLVGPRPEQPQLVEELARVVPYYERRSIVKPGVSGWAQVRCGYAGTPVGTAWKICHDLYYIKRRSTVFDILVMMQTLRIGGRADVELETPAEDFILGETAPLVVR